MSTLQDLPLIVVGVDGSQQSEQALRWGLAAAATLGAHVEAVAAWHLSVESIGLPDNWDPEREMRDELARCIRDVVPGDPSGNVSMVVRQGTAAHVILDEAEGATMIVVGSRGHGAVAGMLLGSVSSAVAAKAHCPVLVVHGETPPALAGAPMCPASTRSRRPVDGGVPSAGRVRS